MYNNIYPYRNNNRYVGGFFGPFILGGITGSLLAPNFYRPNFYPPIYNRPPFPPPFYPPYRPY